MASYLNTVEADNPYGYWRMKATEGTKETDLGSGKNDGTYSGQFKLLEPALIQEDKSVLFNATETTGKMEATTTGTVSGEFTVELWVKIPAFRNSDHLFSTRTGAQTFDIQVNEFGQFHVDLGTGTEWISTEINSEPAALTAGERAHIVYVITNTTLNLYVNSVKNGSETTWSSKTPLLWNAANPLKIAKNEGGTEYAKNTIVDEVAVYAKALTPGRIKRHFELGNPPVEAAPRLIPIDKHKNFAASVIAVAPVPPTTGTSLQVEAATGSRFPEAPFNAVIYSKNGSPINSKNEIVGEIVRIGVMEGDVAEEITRGAETGGVTRTVVAGDIIANANTIKAFTDIEGVLVSSSSALGGFTINTQNLSCENYEHSNLIKTAHTKNLAVGMTAIGAGTEAHVLRGGNRIKTILNEKELELEYPTYGNGVVHLASLTETSEIVKNINTKEIVVGQPVHGTAPEPCLPESLGATVKKINKVDEVGETGEVELTQKATKTGSEYIQFWRNQTFTVSFGGPSKQGGELGEEWKSGQAPWYPGLTTMPTASAPSEPLRAWWQRPLAKYIWPQEQNDNIGIGPKFPNILPKGNGSAGAFGNIAIGGFGDGGRADGCGAAMNNIEVSSCNIALGNDSLYKMRNPVATGEQESGNNVAIGAGALEYTQASNNICVGPEAVRLTEIGGEHVTVGYGCYKFSRSTAGVYEPESGGKQIGMGHQAGRDGIFTEANVLIGHEAGKNAEGAQNVVVGYKALWKPAEFTVASCEVTEKSKIIKASTTNLRKGMIFYDAKVGGGQFPDERNYKREGWIWYIKSIINGTEFEAQRHHVADPWKESVEYKVGDLVFNVVDTAEYKCVKLHTSSSGNKPPNTTYWENNGKGGESPYPTTTETLTLTFAPKFYLGQTIAIGAEAMKEADYKTSLGSISIGFQAGIKAVGNYNYVIGQESGSETTGNYNVAFGYQAGRKFKEYNIGIGYKAGKENTGSENIFIGKEATVTGAESNKLFIGNGTALISGSINPASQSIGFFGHAAHAQEKVAAAASNEATLITLANSLRTMVINNGLMKE